MDSSAKIHVFRLRPHDDLKKGIVEYARQHKITAGVVVTAVGSLEQSHLRFANQKKDGSISKGHFEILSLSGTVSADGCHLHLSLADSDGKTTGGHLLEGNLIYTTAEIALAALPDLSFTREKDPTYGYAELVVKKKNQP